MKKMILSLSALLLTTGFAFAQNTSLTDFVNKYKEQDGFTYALLNKELFEVTIKADVRDKDWQKAHRVIKEIGHLTILVADSTDNALELYTEAKSLVVTSEYDELMSVKDGRDRVRLWAKSDDSMLEDVILLVSSEREFVLINLQGNVDLSNINELMDLFHSDEAKSLAQNAEQSSAALSISPNPGTGLFNLVFDPQDGVPTQIIVSDAQGRRVKDLSLSGQYSQQLDLSALNNGVYYLQLRTNQGKVAVKQVQIMR